MGLADVLFAMWVTLAPGGSMIVPDRLVPHDMGVVRLIKSERLSMVDGGRLDMAASRREWGPLGETSWCEVQMFDDFDAKHSYRVAAWMIGRSGYSRVAPGELAG